MSPEDFSRFLALLSPDAEEAGHLYNRLLKRLTGFFNMKGISDAEAAADEAINRAATKIGAGAPVPEVDRYCLGIARNIAREKRRLTQRETLAFRKFIEDADEFPIEQLERIYGVLKPCFEQLTNEDQQLLLEYCRQIQGQARAAIRRELAEAMQITMLALRVRVTRLRNRLTDCVQKRSDSNEKAPLISNKSEIWSIL